MRGKVVLVPFPFDDLTAVKVRPAVYLTTLIGPHQQVVLAFITSKAAGAILGVLSPRLKAEVEN